MSCSDIEQSDWERDLFGREDDVSKILEELNKVHVLFINGRRYVGKSRCAREVFNRASADVKIPFRFDKASDAIQQPSDLHHFWKRLYKRIGEDCPAMREDILRADTFSKDILRELKPLQTKLLNLVGKESKILLLLDNLDYLWNNTNEEILKDYFMELIKSFRKDTDGNVKVIVTSSERLMFPELGGKSNPIYKLDPLKTEASMEMIVSTVANNLDMGEYLKPIAKLCEGVPMLVMTVGSILGDNQNIYDPLEFLQLMMMNRAKALSPENAPPTDRMVIHADEVLRSLKNTLEIEKGLQNFYKGLDLRGNSFDSKSAMKAAGVQSTAEVKQKVLEPLTRRYLVNLDRGGSRHNFELPGVIRDSIDEVLIMIALSEGAEELEKLSLEHMQRQLECIGVGDLSGEKVLEFVHNPAILVDTLKALYAEEEDFDNRTENEKDGKQQFEYNINFPSVMDTLNLTDPEPSPQPVDNTNSSAGSANVGEQSCSMTADDTQDSFEDCGPPAMPPREISNTIPTRQQTTSKQTGQRLVKSKSDGYEVLMGKSPTDESNLQSYPSDKTQREKNLNGLLDTDSNEGQDPKERQSEWNNSQRGHVSGLSNVNQPTSPVENTDESSTSKDLLLAQESGSTCRSIETVSLPIPVSDTSRKRGNSPVASVSPIVRCVVTKTIVVTETYTVTDTSALSANGPVNPGQNTMVINPGYAVGQTTMPTGGGQMRVHGHQVGPYLQQGVGYTDHQDEVKMVAEQQQQNLTEIAQHMPPFNPQVLRHQHYQSQDTCNQTHTGAMDITDQRKFEAYHQRQSEQLSYTFHHDPVSQIHRPGPTHHQHQTRWSPNQAAVRDGFSPYLNNGYPQHWEEQRYVPHHPTNSVSSRGEHSVYPNVLNQGIAGLDQAESEAWPVHHPNHTHQGQRYQYGPEQNIVSASQNERGPMAHMYHNGSMKQYGGPMYRHDTSFPDTIQVIPVSNQYPIGQVPSQTQVVYLRQNNVSMTTPNQLDQPAELGHPSQTVLQDKHVVDGISRVLH